MGRLEEMKRFWHDSFWRRLRIWLVAFNRLCFMNILILYGHSLVVSSFMFVSFQKLLMWVEFWIGNEFISLAWGLGEGFSASGFTTHKMGHTYMIHIMMIPNHTLNCENFLLPLLFQNTYTFFERNPVLSILNEVANGTSISRDSRPQSYHFFKVRLPKSYSRPLLKPMHQQSLD